MGNLPRRLFARLSPLAKRVVPRPILRFLLLHVLGVNRPYAELGNLASRRCLEGEILPWVGARYANVLFVGAAPYTHHYEKLFRRGQYTTLDSHPSTAVWGAADHIRAPVQDINRHRRPGSFDCVILNGVFGFGVDTVTDQRAVIEALHQAMRPGAFLVVGWNTDRHGDPEALGLFEPFFERNAEAPWAKRRTFAGETHVYDFYRRRP
ncbi:hypothetical protein SAMN02745126_01245 [Enhydrobacter aerosaccus]|uniref:Methyltransferase domain-containing protein n=1 Tax=Enhydrobacter aerosaccus TaxID=225324 RepID=A0A1T4KYP0_9HYPH|nr:class I SAM-dependent methyltransferase [Enhydrobacter aerosaccus]SJZ47575.1 hypothetical protein SAMN02745126_01245 [Enhydrobacter aerosaccus]